MAGIGFELRRILQGETLTALVRAHVLGAVLVLGPFLCSVICLAGFTVLTLGLTDLGTRQIFAGAVVYVFGGSLVTTGLIQVVLTRYLADKDYRGEYESVMQSLFPVLLVTSALLIVSALPVLLVAQISFLAKVILLSLYLIVGNLWMAVIFVRTADAQRAVVAVFLVGSALALAAGLILLRLFGLEGLLLG